MNGYQEEGEVKKIAFTLRVAIYLVAAMLVCLAVVNLCKSDTVVVSATQPGVTDLTDFNFDKNVAEIITLYSESTLAYPNAFYMPEDFASGSITSEEISCQTEGLELGEYGTLRIVLKLPADQVYAVTGKNTSYAQRLFIDGKEYAPIGVPGDTANAVTPKTARYIEGFMPVGERTEFIIHYSNFVHSDGGGLYPFQVGLVRNVARNEQLKIFLSTAVAIALLTAALFFFCLFLFFPKGLYLLWFALICFSISIRSLFIDDKVIMLLIPNLSWYLSIRLEYIFTCALALFSALYVDSLFPKVIKRWVIRSFVVLCCAIILFVCLAKPIVFTRFRDLMIGILVAFILCLIVTMLYAILRKRTFSFLSRIEQSLLIMGLSIYVVFALVGIYGFDKSLSLFGLEYPQVGMMIFLFINVLVLVLGFSRTEKELNSIKQKEREIKETNKILEQLNRTKTNFLANISHEMKTPLTVMSNCAGLTISQLRNHAINDQTEENLDVIQKEAVRLGRLVEQLMQVSLEEERKLASIETDAKTILKRAADFCAPICRGKRNLILIDTEPEQIDICIDSDSILQVLSNLITNANRQIEGGTIVLSAECEGDMVAFKVTDNGEGIAPELIPHIFERGVSGNSSTGLGLAICKEIVEEHGGKIEIENIKGKGTQVCFTLPLYKETEYDHINDRR